MITASIGFKTNFETVKSNFIVFDKEEMSMTKATK